MTKSNMLWFGTLGLLVAASAIDRYRTRREVADLRREHAVVAEGKATTVPEQSRARQQAMVLARVSNPVPIAEPAGRHPSGSDSSATSGADEPPSVSDQAAHIDAVFSAEAEDRNWSREAESKITNGILPLAVGGARLQQVTCRGTVCKVRVEHTTEQGLRDFVERIFTTYGYWDGPMMIAPDSTSPRGSFARVLYYARAGHDLPLLEN